MNPAKNKRLEKERNEKSRNSAAGYWFSFLPILLFLVTSFDLKIELGGVKVLNHPVGFFFLLSMYSF